MGDITLNMRIRALYMPSSGMLRCKWLAVICLRGVRILRESTVGMPALYLYHEPQLCTFVTLILPAIFVPASWITRRLLRHPVDTFLVGGEYRIICVAGKEKTLKFGVIRCIRKLADANCKLCLDSGPNHISDKSGPDSPSELNKICEKLQEDDKEKSRRHDTDSFDLDENKLGIKMRKLLKKRSDMSIDDDPSGGDILEMLESVQDSIYSEGGYT